MFSWRSVLRFRRIRGSGTHSLDARSQKEVWQDQTGLSSRSSSTTSLCGRDHWISRVSVSWLIHTLKLSDVP